MHETKKKTKGRPTSRCDCSLNIFPIATEGPTPAVLMESTDVSRGFNCLKAVLAHWTFVQQLKNKKELSSGDEAFQGTPEYTKPGIRKIINIL